jgi:hypothetical protein
MNIICEYIKHHIRLWYMAAFFLDRHSVLACPGCGLVGRKKVEFQTQYQSVIAMCPRCTAKWGVPPVVPAAQWHIKGLAEFEEEQQTKELAAAVLAQKQRLEVNRE